MSSVQIIHIADDGEGTIIVMDGDLLKNHSKVVRDMIASKTVPEVIHKIVIRGPELEALKFVLEQIKKVGDKKKNKDVLNIDLGQRGVLASLRVHRAILCLQVEPEQFSVAARINNKVARELVAVQEMLSVTDAYSSINNPYGKLYTTMIHTIAWRFVNDPDMQVGRMKQLQEASATQPHLHAAIIAKIAELKEKKRIRGIIAEKRRVRDEKRRLQGF
jgi:hypothetical protein